MFDWLRQILGPKRAAKAPAASSNQIQARYDNAQFNDENARHWSQVDYLSAKAANTFQIRRTLRIRSRYEVSNNPDMFGISNSNADDVVGTGPTLKCLFKDQGKNRRIEAAFNEWALEVGLVEKLRTAKLAKTIDGEGFLILKTVEDLEHSVKLYPVDVEADQVTAPMAKDIAQTWLDGLTLHPVTGRPVSYTVLNAHPGDFMFAGMNPLAAKVIKAKHVIHWFQKFRPGQVRGVPAFTTSLDLFGERRAFRRAVLQKMQVAANLTAVIETEAPADENGAFTSRPFANVPIDRGTSTTLPGGAKMHQYQTGEAGTTYEMFSEQCLREACRPLAYPLNLALGTSQKFNFSSSQLDHRNYYSSLDVERADCDVVCLDRIFAAWLDEAIMIPGLIPSGVNRLADMPHEWHWPEHTVLDPMKEAQADAAKLAAGLDTYEAYWARHGADWRDKIAQQAEEVKALSIRELVFGEPLKKTDTTSDETAEVGNVA